MDLLLLTPSTFFQQLVPWLVLFATMALAWGKGDRLRALAGKYGAQFLRTQPFRTIPAFPALRESARAI